MDVLDFVKFVEAFLAQLASAAGHLHATKWPGKVVGERIVDPDGARFHFLKEALHQPGVVAEQRRAEAHGGIVGQGDGFVKIAIRHQRQRGAKRFLAHQAHGVVHVDDDGRFQKEAAFQVRRPFATHQNLRPSLYRIC